MRCLITGVAGFVGSSLADQLLQRGHEVVGVDCFVDYYPERIKRRNIEAALRHPKFRFVEGDLVGADLAPLLTGIDWVFHQAAQAGVRASWGKSFATYTDNNVLVTQRLLEAIKESGSISKFIYASSSSIYGNAETFPTSEQVTPQPVSPYGVTKLAAEHLVSLYASEFEIPTVSLRYFTVYGPRQRPDMAFHRFIKAGICKQAIALYGDGEQTRDFTYIGDIVDANIVAAEQAPRGSIYNLGGGTRISMNAVLKLIEEVVGPLTIDRQARQAGDARHTSADTSRACKELGFKPKVALREGIEREAAWVREYLEIL